MPSRRGVTGTSREQLLAGTWPHGEAAGPAAVAQLVAQALAAELEGQQLSVRQVARDADLQHTTVLGLLQGQRWPDFVTLVKLEDAVGVTLWPSRH
jgi:hypothetical protein